MSELRLSPVALRLFHQHDGFVPVQEETVERAGYLGDAAPQLTGNLLGKVTPVIGPEIDGTVLQLVLAAEFPSPCFCSFAATSSVAVRLRGLCAVNIVHTSFFLLPRGCFTQKINFFCCLGHCWSLFFYRLKPCGLSSPFSTYCGC